MGFRPVHLSHRTCFVAIGLLGLSGRPRFRPKITDQDRQKLLAIFSDGAVLA